ncbi:MAG: hypothetical protein J0I20_00795 [Chloroflexi bacterium]|nr:hypothetical protein [Chloroflexota bacterium]
MKCPSSSWEAGQQIEPYRLNVQGGKSYVLEFEAGLSQGQLEWLWLDDAHQPVGQLQNAAFAANFTTEWHPGKVHEDRAAPPGAAYLRLIFRPTSPGQVAKFRFYDDSVRVEPFPDYARAAFSFTFDWETAMGGLIHSQGGSPGGVGAESSGQGIDEASLQEGISYAEARGQRMRDGTEYLLKLFTSNAVKATFYGNGYNLLTGNPARDTFVGNPTYKWAAPKNGWSGCVNSGFAGLFRKNVSLQISYYS